MLYFSEFSDDLSMGNAKQSGPSIYAVNQTEKKSDSLNNFLFFFLLDYSLHILTKLNCAGLY